jgi:hypothetical protein
MDRGIKLNTSLYGDSVMAKKVHCERIKAGVIVKNILSPNSIELATEGLKIVKTFQNCSYFSISIDASNKGSQKMYPIFVQYFHIKKGIQNKLMDFYEDPDES